MLRLLIILWSAQPARNGKPTGGVATLSVCSLRDLLQSMSYPYRHLLKQACLCSKLRVELKVGLK